MHREHVNGSMAMDRQNLSINVSDKRRDRGNKFNTIIEILFY